MGGIKNYWNYSRKYLSMKKHRIKIKFWGTLEAVEAFTRFLDENAVCVSSPPLESEQGGFHVYSTIEVAGE